jgi:DNA-binding MarR family transcriptional regulator
MTRLTKLQTALIEGAAMRPDGALRPMSESIAATKTAVTRALDGLVRTGLATHAAAPDEAGAEAGSLVLTEAGRAVVTAVNSVSTKDAAPSTPRGAAAPVGKLGVVLKAIGRKRGATLAELTEATGWQPHTTRAALTRLRQRGFPAALTEEGGRRAYRLQG